MSTEKQDQGNLLDYIISELEQIKSKVMKDEIGPSLHQMQELIEFLTPGLEALEEISNGNR